MFLLVLWLFNIPNSLVCSGNEHTSAICDFSIVGKHFVHIRKALLHSTPHPTSRMFIIAVKSNVEYLQQGTKVSYVSHLDLFKIIENI